MNNTEYIATQQHTKYTAAAHTTDTTYTHNTHRAVEGIAPEEEKLHQVLCYVAPGHVQPFYEVLHERVRAGAWVGGVSGALCKNANDISSVELDQIRGC